MDCHYCGKPATNFDLCHTRVPICDRHLGLGHQVEEILLPEPPKAVAPKVRDDRGAGPGPTGAAEDV